MEDFNNKIEKVGDIYETIKDELIRLTIAPGEHHLQTKIFGFVKELRNIACTEIQNNHTKSALHTAWIDGYNNGFKDHKEGTGQNYHLSPYAPKYDKNEAPDNIHFI